MSKGLISKKEAQDKLAEHVNHWFCSVNLAVELGEVDLEPSGLLGEKINGHWYDCLKGSTMWVGKLRKSSNPKTHFANAYMTNEGEFVGIV